MKTKLTMIQPPALLGILGGGQLGLMFTRAAQRMGYHVVVVDPDPQAPAGKIAFKHIALPYDDAKVWSALQGCAAVTTEFENVPVSLMEKLERWVRVTPPSRAVAIAQNRILEKKAIQKAQLPIAPFAIIESESDLNTVSPLFPGILKTATLVYDGKGQIVINNKEELRNAFFTLKKVPCVLEKKITLKKEASVIITRLNQKDYQIFSVIDNVHHEGILFTSTVPSKLSASMQQDLKKAALHLAENLDYVGVLTVEFFIDQQDRIYVNEIAPRPHNSGHYSLDAALADQFEAQVKILCGLSPPSPSLLCSATMVNLLGDLWPAKGQPDWGFLLQNPKVKLHLYGKKVARKGRKMGHFTLLSEEKNNHHIDELREQAIVLWQNLNKV